MSADIITPKFGNAVNVIPGLHTLSCTISNISGSTAHFNVLSTDTIDIYPAFPCSFMSFALSASGACSGTITGMCTVILGAGITYVYVNFASFLSTSNMAAEDRIYTTEALPSIFWPSGSIAQGFCMCVSEGAEQRGRMLIDQSGNISCRIGQGNFGTTLGNGWQSSCLLYISTPPN